jgi:type II secretion system protein N
VSIRRIITQSVLYTLYTLVAFVIFVYLMFPYDLLQQRLVEGLSQGGRQLAITRLRPAFPFGVRAEGVRLQIEQLSASDPVVQIDTFSAWPEWTTLFAKTIQARFEAALYGGHLEGEVRYHQAEGGPLWELHARMGELEMARHALLRKDDKVFMRGRLSGDAVLTFSKAGYVQDSTMNLRVQALTLLGIPGWQAPLQREIACETLQGALKAGPRQNSTVSLTCQSKDLTFKGEGTVSWRPLLVDSQLNMAWQVRSEEVYKQEVDLLAALVRKRPDRRGELSFRLQGPLRQLRLGA